MIVIDENIVEAYCNEYGIHLMRNDDGEMIIAPKINPKLTQYAHVSKLDKFPSFTGFIDGYMHGKPLSIADYIDESSSDNKITKIKINTYIKGFQKGKNLRERLSN